MKNINFGKNNWGNIIVILIEAACGICRDVSRAKQSAGNVGNGRSRSQSRSKGEVRFRARSVPHVRCKFPYPCDRTWRTDDGTLLYGIDCEDGTTDWYNEDGGCEGSTDTPSEVAQDENDYRNDGYDRRCPYCWGTGYDPLDGGQCDYCDGLGEKPDQE